MMNRGFAVHNKTEQSHIGRRSISMQITFWMNGQIRYLSWRSRGFRLVFILEVIRLASKYILWPKSLEMSSLMQSHCCLHPNFSTGQDSQWVQDWFRLANKKSEMSQRWANVTCGWFGYNGGIWKNAAAALPSSLMVYVNQWTSAILFGLRIRIFHFMNSHQDTALH